jgi:hypothetical protein
MSVTAAGVVAILAGWLAAAGLEGAPRRDRASR